MAYLSCALAGGACGAWGGWGACGAGGAKVETAGAGACGRGRGARGPNDAYFGSKRFRLVARPA